VTTDQPFFHKQRREEGRTTDDGALGSELGQEPGRDTTGRKNNDGSSALFDGSSNGRHGEGLGSLGRSGGELSELVKDGWVGESVLGEVSSLGHYLDCKVSFVSHEMSLQTMEKER
jgi:hypothetical protein